MIQNTNKSFLRKITLQTIKSEKIQRILIFITIMLSTIMMMVVSLYFSSTTQEIRYQLEKRPQVIFLDLSDKTADSLIHDSEIEQYGELYMLDSLTLNNKYECLQYYCDINYLVMNDYPKLHGSIPVNQEEITLTSSLLSILDSNAKLNDTIKINNNTFRITGILPDRSSKKDNYSIIYSKPYALSHVSSSSLHTYSVRFRSTMNLSGTDFEHYVESFAKDHSIAKGNYRMASYYMNYVDMNSDSQTFITICVFLVIAIACSLVIYSIFYISVKQKINHFGRLRMLGVTKRQLKYLVMLEGEYYYIFSVTFGILIGGIIAYFINPKGWNFNITLKYSIAIAIITYLSTQFAIRKPAKYASNATPLEAAKQSYVINNTTQKKASKKHIYLTPFSLAKLYLTRSKKNSILTLLSLSICGILLMCSSAYLNSINTDEMAKLAFPHGNINITKVNTKAKIDFQTIKDALLQQNDSIHFFEYPGLSVTMELENGNTFSSVIESLNSDDLAQVKKYMLEGSSDETTLNNNNGLIVNNSNTLPDIIGWKPKVGDKVTMKNDENETKEFKVVGIYDDGYMRGGYGFFYTTQELLFTVPPTSNDYIYELSLTVPSHDIKEIEDYLKSFLDSSDYYVETLTGYQADLQEELTAEKLPIYILVYFIGIFGIINLINTIFTSIISRKQELSLLQIAGLGKSQLQQLLLYEGLFYSVITLLITLIFGTVFGIIICRVLRSFHFFGTPHFQLPVIPLIIYFGLLFGLQILFSYLSYNYYKKNSLVERIHMLE